MWTYDEQTIIAILPGCPFFREKPEQRAVAVAVEVQPVSQHPAKPVSFARHEATMVD